jgi:hypothetical protein
MTPSLPTSVERGGLGLVVLFVAVGPVVGALTVIVALAVDGQSFETQDPASAARFVALLAPLGWGAYAVGRRRGMSLSGAATAAVLAVVCAIGSVLLVAVAL